MISPPVYVPGPAQFYSRMIGTALNLTNYHYAIRDIVAAAERVEKEGRKVTYLNIGDPQAFDFRPPDNVIDAVVRALRDRFTGYANSLGLATARQAIADYATALGSPTDPNDVVVTSGASEAAELVLTALLDPGDEVLVPSPGYPLYPAILTKLGATPRPYGLDPNTNWQLSIEEITSLITLKTKAIVLINPNNPTGAITSDRVTSEILSIAETAGLLVISDEVYRDLCFEEKPSPISVLATGSGVPVITLESLSKTHMVPGWRVGWMRFTNTENLHNLKAAITKLACGRLCSPTPTQYAIEPALTGDTCFQSTFLEQLRLRRDLVVERFNSHPRFTCTTPAAAFYLMVQAVDSIGDDKRFVRELLEETGVLVVPGSGFGCSPETGYFRIVYLANPEVLEEAIESCIGFASGRFDRDLPHAPFRNYKIYVQ